MFDYKMNNDISPNERVFILLGDFLFHWAQFPRIK